MEKLEEQYDLVRFCTEIGCTGFEYQCPGNPNCAIVKAVFSEEKKCNIGPKKTIKTN